MFEDENDNWLGTESNAWPMVYHCINDKELIYNDQSKNNLPNNSTSCYCSPNFEIVLKNYFKDG